MLLMLIIVSSYEINSYQPVQNEERTDVIKQEIKKEPSEWDIDKAIKLHNPKASQSYRTKIMEQIEIIKTNLSYNEYI